LIGASDSIAGVPVTEESAMRISAVYACCRVLSESISQLPCHLMERQSDGSKRRATDHPIYKILRYRPNPKMTPMQFQETMMWHLAMRGNSYSFIERDGSFRPKALWPLRPSVVTVEFDGWEPKYRVNGKNGKQFIIPAIDIMHVRGPSDDGLMGLDPIRLAMRDTVGVSIATNQYGARLFKNSAMPAGVIKFKNKLSEERQAAFRQNWNDIYGGSENANRLALLFEDTVFEKIAIDPEQAQFLETRRFQIEDIARIFRVPPHLIGHLDKATFNNIANLNLYFARYTLLGWLVRLSQQFVLSLMREEEQERFYFAYKIEAFEKMDLLTRYRAYQIGRYGGWLNADEIRGMEDMNPREDGRGGEYWNPSNMEVFDTGNDSTDGTDNTDPNNDPDADKEDQEDNNRDILIGNDGGLIQRRDKERKGKRVVLSYGR
jgi:HK97 family phage portal protein